MTGMNPTPIEEKVKACIEEMLDPKKAEAAYKKLEKLGAKAVPAIIMNMDERRDLPVKHITLAIKSKNAFEAYRHYGPQKIIDVLAAILNQITGKSFGEISNGGTGAQRTRVYEGWVAWLSDQK